MKLSSIFIFLIFISISHAVTLFCQRVWWFYEQIHCELELLGDIESQVLVTNVTVYGAEIFDAKKELVVSYAKQKSKFFPAGIGNLFQSLEVLEISVAGLKFVEKNCFENMENLKVSF